MHIQAFADLLIGNWCQVIPRLRLFMISQNSSFLVIKNSGILNFEIQKWTTKVSKKWKANVSGISNLSSFRHPQKIFSRMFPGCSLIFTWFVSSILVQQNEEIQASKTKKSIVYEMLSFRCLMPWNRDFISSIWRRKIQLRH